MPKICPTFKAALISHDPNNYLTMLKKRTTDVKRLTKCDEGKCALFDTQERKCGQNNEEPLPFTDYEPGMYGEV